jgi:hypothetical protein
MLLQYQMPTYKTLNDCFYENPGTRHSHMLDVMESFHRLTPMALSLGQIVFTCPCEDGFRCMPLHGLLSNDPVFCTLGSKAPSSKTISCHSPAITKKYPLPSPIRIIRTGVPWIWIRINLSNKAHKRTKWHSVIANVGNSDSSVSSLDDPTEAKKSKGPVLARRPKLDHEGASQVPAAPPAPPHIHTYFFSFQF